MKISAVSSIVTALICTLLSTSSYAMGDGAAACEAAMIGTFKIVEKRGATGSEKTDDGELVKISRRGKNFSFSFLSPDGKTILDDDGQPNDYDLEAIDPERIVRSFTGNEEENIARVKKIKFVACGLAGKDGYFTRTSSVEGTSFTGTFGSGFGSAVITLESVK
jgi:hypothetical protein